MNLSIHFNVLVALVSLSFGFPSDVDASGSVSHGYPWGIDISTLSSPPKEASVVRLLAERTGRQFGLFGDRNLTVGA